MKIDDVKIANSGIELNERIVEEFESRTSLKLPSDYRKFLLSSNGGTPSPSSFNLPSGVETRVNQFFSLKEGNTGHWQELEFKFNVRDEILKPDKIPIGRDDYGNQVCIQSDPTGTIFFEDQEFASVTKIADSFSSFLSSLRDSRY
ncbi:SMI1/KNR4 family protein [Verrucomicrobiales bacterium]|nr:SMI1/KNR4 family protein [Verrucomicrobiales bacterium]